MLLEQNNPSHASHLTELPPFFCRFPRSQLDFNCVVDHEVHEFVEAL